MTGCEDAKNIKSAFFQRNQDETRMDRALVRAVTKYGASISVVGGYIICHSSQTWSSEKLKHAKAKEQHCMNRVKGCEGLQAVAHVPEISQCNNCTHNQMINDFDDAVRANAPP